MRQKQKRPDLFCPEIENFIRNSVSSLILVTKENALESSKEFVEKKENIVKK